MCERARASRALQRPRSAALAETPPLQQATRAPQRETQARLQVGAALLDRPPPGKHHARIRVLLALLGLSTEPAAPSKGVEVPLQIVAVEIRAAKDETVVHLEALYEPDQRREFEPLDALRPAEWVGVPRLHLALPHVCHVHLIGRVSREGRRAP